MTPDLDAAITPVADAFDDLGVSYYLAGSVVSSLNGVARATADVDVVAALPGRHAAALVDRLGDDYYADVDTIRDALAHRAMFNAIHQPATRVAMFNAIHQPATRVAATRLGGDGGGHRDAEHHGDAEASGSGWLRGSARACSSPPTGHRSDRHRSDRPPIRLAATRLGGRDPVGGLEIHDNDAPDQAASRPISRRAR